MIKIVIIQTGEVLYSDSNFSYTRQIGDVGNIAVSNTSHTNSFNIIKNKDSIRVFEGLGLQGSASNYPYKIVECTLYHNEIEVIQRGNLIITESNGSFKASVQDGNIDFWKAIEGLKIGDLDISELTHEKTYDVVRDSLIGNDKEYKYFVADYGGDYHVNKMGTMFLNIDFMSPSVQLKYIIDKIFNHIGFTYNISVDINLWWTYAKSYVLDEIEENKDYTEILIDGISMPFSINGSKSLPFIFEKIANGATTSITNQFGRGVTNLDYGQYKVFLEYEDVFASYTLQYWDDNDPFTHESFFPVKVGIMINGVEVGEHVTNITLNENDIITPYFEPYVGEEFWDRFGFRAYDVIAVDTITVRDFKMKIQSFDVFQGAGDAIENFGAKEFIKELMHYYGLTLSVIGRQVNFYTINERLNSNVEVYSDRVIKINSEKYSYRNYAKRNLLKHKYVNQDTGYNDSSVNVDNQNLKEENTLLQSFSYTPTRLGVYEMYESEAKEDEDGNIFFEYKELADRSFMLTEEKKEALIVLSSTREEIEGLVPYKEYSFASQKDANFRELYTRYYSNFNRVLNNANIINVDLDISLIEMTHINLIDRIYLNNAYYLINKLMYRGSGVSAELIKID